MRIADGEVGDQFTVTSWNSATPSNTFRPKWPLL